MTRNLDRLATLLIAVSASVVALLSVLRYIRTGDRAAGLSAGVAQGVEYDSLWKDLTAGGIPFGSAHAPLTIVEFADLECPACRSVHKAILEQMSSMPDSVRLVVHHFPLEIHRFARQAAQAFECADSLGDGLRFLTNLYEHQDSIGLRAWHAYATDGGVKDLRAFETCRQKPTQHPRIAAGLEAGAKHGVRATPTVLVNGWRFRFPPGTADLRRVANSILSTGSPPSF